MKHLRHIVMLTQFGLSVALPLVLCVLLARYLMLRFSLGGWVMILGILLGIGGAVSGLAKGLKQMQREAERDREPAPPSFNDHQ